MRWSEIYIGGSASEVSEWIEPGFLGKARLYCERKLLEPSELVSSRDQSFRLGRRCASVACQSLGVSVEILKKDSEGLAIWPDGIVGSIAHTVIKSTAQIVAVAAVARKADYSGVGIDIERLTRPIRVEISERVLSGFEIELFRARHEKLTSEWVLKIFSAKEAIYKCWYPEVRQYFGFDAARLISFDPTGELRFEVKLPNSHKAFVQFVYGFEIHENFWVSLCFRVG